MARREFFASGGARGRLPGHLADRKGASLSVTAGAYPSS
jgi:hypothetical protein